MAEFYTSRRASNEAAFLFNIFAREFGTNNFPDWGHRGLFPKSYAKDICGLARVRYRSLCCLAVSAAAWLEC